MLNYEERKALEFGGGIGKKQLEIIDCVDSIGAYCDIDPSSTDRYLDRILVVVRQIEKERKSCKDRVLAESKATHDQMFKK